MSGRVAAQVAPPTRRRRAVAWACRAPATVAVGLVLAVAATAGVASPAAAHEPGTTGIELEVGDTAIGAVFDLPLVPLEAALGATVPTDALRLSLNRDVIVGYLGDHLEVASGDDVWTETFGRLTAITVGGVESLRIAVTLQSTTAVATDGFTFAYDGLVERDPGQLVFVTVLDEAGAVSLAGVLDEDTGSLFVEPPTGEESDVAFGVMVGEGFSHVLDGADHMLFLLVLLLPAPLAAVRRRWRADGNGWQAFRKVAQVATAFTVGHSLTLALSALGRVNLPTRMIEVLIGVSVAVSAVHAIRPLVARGELFIAAGFGLVHGLAFAGILDDLGLQSASLAALAGFNVGIEAAQLAIVGLAFPSLLVMSRRSVYPAVRTATAIVALAAATGWVVERLGLAASPLAPIETLMVDHLGWGVGVLAAAAVASVVFARATPALITNSTPSRTASSIP